MNSEPDLANPETQSEKSEPKIVGFEPPPSLPELFSDIPEPIDLNCSSSSDVFQDAMGDTAELINVLKQVAKSGTNVKIDAFKGTSDINTWFQAFEATTAGRDDPDKLRLLTSALKEDALTWFGLQLSKDSEPDANGDVPQATNYATWKARLIKHYSEPTHLLLDKLANRKMIVGETIEKYTLDVLNLCNKISKTMVDAEKIHHVRKGLLPLYKEKSIMLDVPLIDDFVNKLKYIESALASDFMQQPVLNEEKLATLITTAMKKAEPVLAHPDVQNYGQDINELKTMFREFMDRDRSYQRHPSSQNREFHPNWQPNHFPNQSFQQRTPIQNPNSGYQQLPNQYPNQGYQRQPTGRRPPPQNQFQGNCNFCGMFGHKYRNCRKRESGQEPQYPQSGGQTRSGGRSLSPYPNATGRQ